MSMNTGTSDVPRQDFDEIVPTVSGLSGSSTSAFLDFFGLADGIFVVAMTLLVLGLDVPHLRVATNGALTSALLHLWPNITAYALGFCTLFNLWNLYHFIVRKLQRLDPVLIILNGFFLLFIALIPFMTGVLGRYPEFEVSEILYGITLAACTSIGTAALVHARRKNLVKDSAQFLGPIQKWMISGVIGFVISAAIAVAIAPVASYILYWLWNLYYWVVVVINRERRARMHAVAERAREHSLD